MVRRNNGEHCDLADEGGAMQQLRNVTTDNRRHRKNASPARVLKRDAGGNQHIQRFVSIPT